jgi:hypothetical protein
VERAASRCMSSAIDAAKIGSSASGSSRSRSAAGQDQPLQVAVHPGDVDGDRINLTRAARPLPLGCPALLVQIVSHRCERLHDGLHAVPEFDTRQIPTNGE